MVKAKNFRIIVLMFNILLCSGVFAQGKFRIELSVQPQTTWLGDYQVPQSISSIYPVVSLTRKSNVLVEVGGSVIYRINDLFGIGLGLNYSQMGQQYEDYKSAFNFNGGSGIYSWHREVSLNYVKIPLQFYYTSDNEKKVSFYGCAGLYIGFLSNYRDVNKYGLSSTSFNVNIDQTASDNSNVLTANVGSSNGNGTAQSQSSTNLGIFSEKPYASNDFGISLGAGISIKLTDKLRLPIMFTYSGGVMNVKNLNSLFVYTDPSGKPNNILFWSGSLYSPDPNGGITYFNRAMGIKFGLNILL